MRLVSTALAAITFVGVGARLLPLGLSALPGLAVVVSATPWYALTAAAALVLTLAGGGRRPRRKRMRRRACTLALCACLALELTWQAPFFSHAFAQAGGASGSAAAAGETAGAATLRVMTCNVYKGAADPAQIVELVRSEGVQVLTLQETTKDFVAQLEALGLDELLPYSERSSSDGVYGNGVWSALPLANTASDDIGSSASAMPAGTVTVSDGTASYNLRFVSVHTCAPVAGYWDLWRKSIEEIGVVRSRLAEDASTRYVLMGDFNATYDHAPFRAMLGSTLTDAARQAGEGLTFSWPTNQLVPAFCGIDHVVVSPGITASALRAHRVSGSDHAALVATLTISQ